MEINPLNYLIFKPIKFWISSKYGDEIIMDYLPKEVRTPFGNLKMREGDKKYDVVKLTRESCLYRIEKKETSTCERYPFKGLVKRWKAFSKEPKISFE